MLLDACFGTFHPNPGPLFIICGLGLSLRSRLWGYLTFGILIACVVVP
jgi:hypothetical protein